MTNKELKDEILKYNKDSYLPLYAQIANRMEDLILNNELRTGEKLPGDEDLSKLTGTSKVSISKAYSLLVEKGLVIRKKNKGTCVNFQITSKNKNIGFYYRSMSTLLSPN